MDNATHISFDLKTDKGENVSVMRQVIEKRVRELGETSKGACVALAINVLKSLRVGTKVAKENEKPYLVVNDVSGQYFPSWKRVGGKKKRILRSGENGSEVKPNGVRWICSKYFKGQKVYTYKVVDVVGEDRKFEYLLVSDTKKQAEDWAKQRHKNRIKQHKNLAKFALGEAMRKVHVAENPNDQLTDEARTIGLNNTQATVSESGFDNGSVDVHIEDNLRYATDALKESENAINEATTKALNKMVGFINHKLHQRGIYDDIKIPKEEMIDGQ